LCSARGNHPIYAVSGKRCAASDYKIVTATSYMPFLRREKLDICSKMVLHNPKVAQVAHKKRRISGFKGQIHQIFQQKTLESVH
ncbi:hypothetical protein, partial [uncultured Gemmiger sp.]|uniref:hypothetical protein n=1 Tax=uncultured Gemmiger sp. TaxID=1623490 RepID=UPI0025E02CD0